MEMTKEGKMFVNYMIRKKYAKKTIDLYILSVRAVQKYAGKRLSHITAEDFNNYIDSIAMYVSHSKINQIVSAAKLFLIYGLGKTDQSLRKLERPRESKPLPKVLSIEEIRTMLNRAINLKHKAIILLLYDLGIRRQELLDLKWSHICRKTMTVNILNSKGAKDRNIPITNRLIELLETYWKVHKSKEYVVEHEGSKYSATSVSNVITRYSKGFRFKVTPHCLRHTLATHLLEMGVDIRYIQAIFGHSSTKTTEIYLHVATAHLQNLPRMVI